jgi:L-arabinokinase
MSAPLRFGSLTSVTCDAPGRLDFLGGVADYSGSLVLEMPTQVRTSVTLQPENTTHVRIESRTFGQAQLELAPLRELVGKDAAPVEFRAHLDENKFPRWARYPLGCFISLVRQTHWFPNSGFHIEIGSAVPDGQGVSSSAALEIATLRAFNKSGNLGLSPIELARLGQKAENLIVGAACGLMDQLASSCGRPGELLPILCRPDTLYDSLPLPQGLMIAGWPSGVKHQVGASPYATARAASFMGKRILEKLSRDKWRYTSEISIELFRRHESSLPQLMTGGEFLASYQGTDDPLTQVDSNHSYPIRAATRFPIEEKMRAHRARQLFADYKIDPPVAGGELRSILRASHEAYSAMGLGSPETDALLECFLDESVESGFIAGRISGGGSGGTVVVLIEKRAEEKLLALSAAHGNHAIIF